MVLIIRPSSGRKETNNSLFDSSQWDESNGSNIIFLEWIDGEILIVKDFAVANITFENHMTFIYRKSRDSGFEIKNSIFYIVKKCNFTYFTFFFSLFITIKYYYYNLNTFYILNLISAFQQNLSISAKFQHFRISAFKNILDFRFGISDFD